MWTAGPATLAGIYLASFVAFGTHPSASQILYFVIFSMVVGISAIGANLISDALNTPRLKERKQRLLENIDSLFRLTLHARDLHLGSLPDSERQIMMSYYLMQNAGTSGKMLGIAAGTLTGEPELGRAVERVVALDEQGLYTSIADEWQWYKPLIDKVRGRIEPIAPQAYQLLVRILKGEVPHVRQGSPRTEGFLNRISQAVLEGSPEKMTLADAHELFLLTFELMNGRHLAILKARFSGDQLIGKAKSKLDSARKKYILARRERNSALRLFLSRLQAQGAIEWVPGLSQDGTWLEELKNGVRGLRRDERKLFLVDYKSLQQIQHKARIARAELERSLKSYNHILQAKHDSPRLALEKGRLKKAGFYIQQEDIGLSDEQIMRLSTFISEELVAPVRSLGPREIKLMTMDLASELVGLIGLNQSEVQLAIESSNALAIGCFSQHNTPATKVGWARLLVEGMHENRRLASHHLARSLVSIYRVRFSEAVIEMFEEEFGASQDYLRSLKLPEAFPGSENLGANIPVLEPIPQWESLFNQVGEDDT